MAWLVISLCALTPGFAQPAPEPLAWDSLTKQQTFAPGETAAQFTFSVTNVSAVEVVVEKVSASCGCTAVQLPAQPWRLVPGAHGDLKFTMNLLGKHGTVTKTATVQTSVGIKVLTLSAIIPETGKDALPSVRSPESPGRDTLPRARPSHDIDQNGRPGGRPYLAEALPATADGQGRAGSPNGAHGVTRPTSPPEPNDNRARNQSLALADHQAVFRGDCARCHAEPAKGKSGKELYVAVCGICHDAEHRASMVPLLGKSDQAGNAAYWRTWITFGKHGSLMPAFSQPLGGPLTREQIESLSEYLSGVNDDTQGRQPTSTP